MRLSCSRQDAFFLILLFTVNILLLTLPCCLQYRDLPHTTVLAVTVWEAAEGKPIRPLGGGTMRLFSKHGRLKTGTHRLHLWEGQEADPSWPSATPGKQPVQQRGEIGCVLYDFQNELYSNQLRIIQR